MIASQGPGFGARPPGGGFYQRVTWRVTQFVRAWRRLDACVNRPLPADRAIAWRLLAPDFYPWFVPVLAAALLTVMALGPTFEFGGANLVLLALGLGLLLLLHYLAMLAPRVNQYLLAGQLAILLFQTVLLVQLSRPEVYGSAPYPPRLHVGAAVVIALAVGLGMAWGMAAGLFRAAGAGRFALMMSKVEFFAPNDRYDDAGQAPLIAVLSAAFYALLRYPVPLLLPPALIVVFWFSDRYLWTIFLLTALVIWALLVLGIYFERLMEIFRTLGRLFFVGPQFVVSVLVITVAVLRLLEVRYVTYLFEAGSATLMIYLALAYITAWFYGFWTDQFVARRLIWLLEQERGSLTPVSVPYPYDGDAALSRVQAKGRTISLHGAGRLKLSGLYEPDYAPDIALQFMTPRELVASYRSAIERMPVVGGFGGSAGRLLSSLRNFQRATLVYPVIVGTIAYVLIGGPALYNVFYGIQPAELSVSTGAPAGMEVGSLLSGQRSPNGFCGDLAADAPRIVVAASGGGTRAALYTASVLRGLAQAGFICNIVAVSGVSGGSAALAYFALHESELRVVGSPSAVAWDRFDDAMARSYIGDVIDRASDMRIAYGRWHWRNFTCGETEKPDEGTRGRYFARTRLGSILAESFVCHLGAGTMRQPSFGILLNTSIVGSFPDAALPCERDKDLPLAERATLCRSERNGSTAGGRLVLSNLRPPRPPPVDGSPHMEMVTLDDGDMSIARAAALSANFPPVFPDAALDVSAGASDAMRYWVTDGGAVENRAVMTLLYAVRDGLNRVAGRGVSTARPAPLFVVVADASASVGRYSESLGFGSILNAGGQLGLGIEAELRGDLQRLYCSSNAAVRFRELAMPPALRDGIGTHWLLPAFMTFSSPTAPADLVTLDAGEVRRILIDLHGGRGSMKGPALSEDGRRVRRWAFDGPLGAHDANWRSLLSELRAPVVDVAPCAPTR